MPQRRSHACRAARLEAADPALHGRRQALAERLDRVDLDAVAALAGESVDRVQVADLLERGRHDDQRVLRDVDDAMVIMAAALEEIGDLYAVYGFSGQGRDGVEVYPVKAFGERLTRAVQSRIGEVRRG